MNTRKWLSNISFNTPEWLKFTLERLRHDGLIDFWLFVPHKPEEEKDVLANKKEHIHLMFIPSKMIQTKTIDDEFNEYDPKMPDKPRRLTQVWHTMKDSNFADWWLYSLHDRDYLRMKGLERQYHYSIKDAVCSDDNSLERLISFIDLGEVYRKEIVFTAAAQGMSYSKAIASGIFGDHPERYALMYKALLTDRLTEEIKKASESRERYESLIAQMKGE